MRSVRPALPDGGRPDSSDCPHCASDGRRQITATRLGRGGSASMRLLDATARSASEPTVVSGPAPGARRTPQKVTTNPLHRKCPAPEKSARPR
ncbi:zinc ribbon domain-containing protein [Rhodococcus hoagii]|nr:zinc ribbon domain-containing protein [Prescottella equi]